MELNLQNETTSEFAVSKLFECWQNKDFKEAEKYIQKTWLSNSHENEFKKMFGWFELTGFYIYDKEIVTDCRHEVRFRVEMIFKNKQITRYGNANTICETGKYAPDPKGQWGVNPISLLRWVK
jgi:hypothetical protein